MVKFLNINIETPEKKIFEGKILSLVAPGIEGEFGVLPEHTPFVTVLKPGVVSFKKEDGNIEMLAVSGGYIEVTRDKVILLVETAERPEEIDIETIKRRKEEKEKLLKSKSKKDIDYDMIQSELLKEIAKLKAAE
ncbi:MAG: ATP synthase F1 subunit epsilon, partial [Candidatus Goldbacteria bacterium]|nr:ATP synthase F1 subunit epsilon [Candidatus Goldiibacteriota bacterium]